MRGCFLVDWVLIILIPVEGGNDHTADIFFLSDDQIISKIFTSDTAVNRLLKGSSKQILSGAVQTVL